MLILLNFQAYHKTFMNIDINFSYKIYQFLVEFDRLHLPRNTRKARNFMERNKMPSESFSGGICFFNPKMLIAKYHWV